MKKIRNKSINYGLKTLTILAFAFAFVPFNVSAQVCGEGGCNYVYGNPSHQVQPSDYTSTPTVTPTVYSHSNGTNSNKTNGATTNSNNANTSNSGTGTTNSDTTNGDNSATNSGNGLAASAIFGTTGSFLPSGIVQWVLFAIFVLIIVILARIIFGARARYEAQPLKYE